MTLLDISFWSLRLDTVGWPGFLAWFTYCVTVKSDSSELQSFFSVKFVELFLFDAICFFLSLQTRLPSKGFLIFHNLHSFPPPGQNFLPNSCFLLQNLHEMSQKACLSFLSSSSFQLLKLTFSQVLELIFFKAWLCYFFIKFLFITKW